MVELGSSSQRFGIDRNGILHLPCGLRRHPRLVVVRGTNTREWMGHAPTGKSFVVDHIHIYRLEGDRIAEHWGVRDDLGTLRQLGHLG